MSSALPNNFCCAPGSATGSPLLHAPAGRLRRVPVVAALCHTAAAHGQMAEGQREAEELGAAVACMARAVEKAREALALVSGRSGWYFSKALPGDQLPRFVRERRALV